MNIEGQPCDNGLAQTTRANKRSQGCRSYTDNSRGFDPCQYGGHSERQFHLRQLLERDQAHSLGHLLQQRIYIEQAGQRIVHDR